jgi:hypothetical protein
MVEPIINIYRTKQEAFFFENSPINSQYIFKGVQLLPNNPTKYIQVTNTPNGINLEDWTVYVVDCKGNKTNITANFLVESLTNGDNGSPQLYWSLENISVDFGWQMVYLEINQAVGETFYSTPFMITDTDIDRVTQFHYKDHKDDIYQCIGLRAWFLENTKQTELTTYYEVSTRNTVSTDVKVSKLKIYRTELMPKDLLILLTDILESPIVYINSVRSSLFDAVDFSEKVSQENFSKIDFTVSQNKNDRFGMADYNGYDYSNLDYSTT